MNPDIDLVYEDFTPDDDTRNWICAVADKLQFSAPSDAILRIALKQSSGKLLATCRIVSQAGTFVAEAIADQPVRAVRQVEEKIRKQLQSWKAHRFDVSRLQNPNVEEAV